MTIHTFSSFHLAPFFLVTTQWRAFLKAGKNLSLGGGLASRREVIIPCSFSSFCLSHWDNAIPICCRGIMASFACSARHHHFSHCVSNSTSPFTVHEVQLISGLKCENQGHPRSTQSLPRSMMKKVCSFSLLFIFMWRAVQWVMVPALFSLPSTLKTFRGLSSLVVPIRHWTIVR